MAGLLEGKVAVVTGAGSGIGRAITTRAVAEGAQVLAADISGAEEQVAKELGANVVPQRTDLTKPEQVAAMVAACRERFGRLDVLFNNAGIGHNSHRVHEYPLEMWDDVMNVNARGAFLVLKHCLALMLEHGRGAVVNTVSTGGFRATPGSSAYNMSKGAMVMLTRVAALEYVKDNIRVNAICPGPSETPMLAGGPEELLEGLKSQIPMGRFGRPAEIASLAIFLASDQASYITGQCCIIDGGQDLQ
jgi:NAD(P)-dependent dehydrogenase (short-subunit alcohol dehydrogenase family)